MKKNLLYCLCSNALVFIFELIGLLWMFLGWGTSSSGVLTASRLNSLKYFTVDSNIIMFFVSIFVICDILLVILKKKNELSRFSYIFSLVGTVGVTLTMLVTIFFLEPTMGPKYGYLSLFTGSNFFLHGLNPILSLVTFLSFMKTKEIRKIHTLSGIIPMVIYAVYYIVAASFHIENGKVVDGYDWYGFLVGGIGFAFIIIPLLIGITYLISYGLWRLNRIKLK